MYSEQDYNVDLEFYKCMDHLDDIMDILIYTRLALALELDLTNDLFPTLFPAFDPFKTVGKYC
jgi:hypothetical protein